MQEIRILLVEDNEGDVVLAREAFSDARLINELSVVHDGEEALDYLYRRNRFTNVELPDLVLLDINIPKISGLQVLKKVKEDPVLRMIPVVVLTSSEAETDINEAYRNYVNCYITKPVDLEKFLQVARQIEKFWLQIVKLPDHSTVRQ